MSTEKSSPEIITDDVADPPAKRLRKRRPKGVEGMVVNAVANVFGSNRSNAEIPGYLLTGCRLIVVPFGGGMCELPYLVAKQRVANDLHRHIINLCRVIQDPKLLEEMKAIVEPTIHHPDVLATAQAFCRDRETQTAIAPFVGMGADVEWAAAYAVCSWMGRGGDSGKKGEFTKRRFSVRYDADGGGSNQRFRSWINSLEAWHKVLVEWEFDARDFRVVIELVGDDADTGMYVDMPWPSLGKDYHHAFAEGDHRVLAARLNQYELARIVIRINDCSLTRELYPEGPKWRYDRFDTQNQGNKAVTEVLISARCPLLPEATLADVQG